MHEFADIEHRLITMRRSVAQLDELGAVDRARLESHHATGLVVERILALLVDGAFVINTRVARTVLGVVPQTSAAGFAAAGEAGLIDAGLAATLTPEDGPHNVVMQLCLDSEPDAVAAVVAEAVAGYGEYVRQVSHWITTAETRSTR